MAAVSFAAMSLVQNGTAKAADVTINLAANKQVIRGFGASSAWCGTLSTGIMDSLFKDLGYSILRVRIEEGIGDNWQNGPYTQWNAELTNAKNAIARGAIVFASPWNPPASMKSNGKLNTAKYADYAKYLQAYAKYFADNGAPLYAVSIQNEPDYANDWTAWTATDLMNFLTAHGAALSSAFRVMMPESFQFLRSLSDPALNDATVSSYISIIGGHLYGGRIADYPLARNQGKEIWETEHYFDDDSISNIMKLGKEIHDCMVTGNMNAYVYWWITWDNGLCTSSGTLFKRAYTLAQFAKHIRPGYTRVDATAAPATNVSVSAYKGSGKLVIVAVNSGTSAASQKFVVSGGTVTQVSSSQTNASSNMAAGANYPVSDGSFTASLSAQSITTFVGNLDGYVEPDGGASDGPSGAGGRDARGTSDAAGAGAGGRDAGGGAGNGGGGASGGQSAGGRSGTGGTSSGGGGGSESGGSTSSGGRASSVAPGGAMGGSSKTTSDVGGGDAAGSSVNGSEAGGSTNTGGSTHSASGTSAGSSSGCSCALAGRDGRGFGGGIAFILVLGGLVMARRRERAR
jgi:glucuronoarabinoxylan endo-1,4-beta-xylanase